MLSIKFMVKYKAALSIDTHYIEDGVHVPESMDVDWEFEVNENEDVATKLLQSIMNGVFKEHSPNEKGHVWIKGIYDNSLAEKLPAKLDYEIVGFDKLKPIVDFKPSA